MVSFLKKYAMSVLALAVALIVLFFVLNQLGHRLPAPVGTVAEKVGSLASGQAYQFSA